MYELTPTTIENTDSPITSVMDLVVTQLRVAIRFDPDSGHGVIEDFVVLDDSKAPVVDQDSAILPTPDLIPDY